MLGCITEFRDCTYQRREGTYLPIAQYHPIPPSCMLLDVISPKAKAVVAFVWHSGVPTSNKAAVLAPGSLARQTASPSSGI